MERVLVICLFTIFIFAKVVGCQQIPTREVQVFLVTYLLIMRLFAKAVNIILYSKFEEGLNI